MSAGVLHRTLRAVFWLHLVLGVAAGPVIALLAATGIVMSFETVVTDRMERAMMNGGGGQPMAVDRLLSVARARFPGMRGGVLEIRSDPALPWVYRAGRGGRRYLDPATADDLGAGPEGARRFFQAVVSLHRWLVLQPGGEGERGKESAGWRKWGGAITSAACMAYLALAATGLPLWLRGIRHWAVLRAKCWFRRGLSGKARDWNWHHVLGWWALPGILAITLTGTVMAYPWANRMLFAAFGETPPARGEGRRHRPADMEPAGALAQLPAMASARMPGWQTLEISGPARSNGASCQIIISDAGRGRSDRRLSFELTGDGLVPATTADGGGSPAARARRLVRWIHTGEAGGWWGQVLAVSVCAATLVLVWTGCALGWRRWKRWRQMRQP